jgi:hypothetical protein
VPAKGNDQHYDVYESGVALDFSKLDHNDRYR